MLLCCAYDHATFHFNSKGTQSLDSDEIEFIYRNASLKAKKCIWISILSLLGKRFTLQRNQELLAKSSVMMATVYHWHWQQTESQCFPSLLPWQDCAIPSVHMEFRARTYNTAFTNTLC